MNKIQLTDLLELVVRITSLPLVVLLTGGVVVPVHRRLLSVHHLDMSQLLDQETHTLPQLVPSHSGRYPPIAKNFCPKGSGLIWFIFKWRVRTQ